MSDKWFAYVLLCNNNSFYRGYTNDLDKRLELHQSGKGAKYTRMHKPIKIIYSEEFSTKEEAMKRECYFKSAQGKKWLAERLAHTKNISSAQATQRGG